VASLAPVPPDPPKLLGVCRQCEGTAEAAPGAPLFLIYHLWQVIVLRRLRTGSTERICVLAQGLRAGTGCASDRERVIMVGTGKVVPLPRREAELPDRLIVTLSNRRDPRLVQLVRLLARQAADEYFDALPKKENGTTK
jgi:hypothetical protein